MGRKKRQYREQRKLLTDRTIRGHCPIDVRQEIDIDIEIDSELPGQISCTEVTNNNLDKYIYRIIEKWNKSYDGVNKIKVIIPSSERYVKLQKLISMFSEEQISKAISNINESAYLTEKTNKFSINFDWFIEPNNFTNVLENYYKDHKTPNRKNSFNNFKGQSNNYSEEELNNIALNLRKSRSQNESN